MNIKKLTALSLALVLTLGLVAGCSGKASMDSSTNGAPMESPMYGGVAEDMEIGLDYGMADSYDTADPGSAGQSKPSIEASTSSSSTADVPVSQQKLIRKIFLDAETEDMDALLFAINTKVSALGGYVENREIYTGSAYSTYSNRRANLVIRIPKDHLDEFVSHVSETSNVISTNETSEDVTLTYVSTKSRMTALQKEEERLLSLIDKAANLTELLELERRLTEVRTDLEYVTSKLLVYDNLVDYGTVTVSISEVQKLTPVAKPGFWQRLSTGFVENLQNLWTFLKELVIFLVSALPYLVPLTALLVGLIFLIRLRRKKHKKNADKRKPPFPTEPPAEK